MVSVNRPLRQRLFKGRTARPGTSKAELYVPAYGVRR